MLSFLLWVQVVNAGDLVVPPFTPGSVSDFGPSERLAEETMSALASANIAFIPPSEVTRRGGEMVTTCADSPDCPAHIFEVFPSASLVLVGTTTWNEGRLDSEVRFYLRGDPSPIEIIQGEFRPEDSAMFGAEVASIADEIQSFGPQVDLTPTPVAQEPDTTERQQGSGTPSRDRLGDQKVYREPDEDRVESAPLLMPRAWHGLPQRSQTRFVLSQQDWPEWRRKRSLRTGRFEISAWGGMGFGDVSRQYDIRVALNEPTPNNFQETGRYGHHDFIVDSGFVAGFGVSFAPAWWFDLGLIGSFQAGQKHLSTGWEQYLDGERVDYDIRNHDPAFAGIGILEPRIRLFLVPLGPVKPYVAGGAAFRILDGYQVPDLDDVAYPDLPSVIDLMVVAGGGLAIDLPVGLTILMDVPWGYRLNQGPLHQELTGQEPASSPLPAPNTRQVLTFRGGLGVRL